MVNGASIYSYPWSIEKITPNKIVKIKPFLVSFLFSFIILWWDHVIVAPEEIKIKVFNKGIRNGLNGVIPLGGQIPPISIEGESDLWKKAQKKRNKEKNFWGNKKNYSPSYSRYYR